MYKYVFRRWGFCGKKRCFERKKREVMAGLSLIISIFVPMFPKNNQE